MIKARVHVSLRPVVLDPQGQAVGHSLVDLGYREVKSARVGKFIDLELDLPAGATDATDPAVRAQLEARLREMAQKVFANPVLEDFAVEIMK